MRTQVFTRTRGCLSVLLLVVAAPRMRAAQPTTAVGVTAGISTQSRGAADGALAPALGGSTVGALLFVDRQLSDRIQVGAEVSVGANIDGHQQQRLANAVSDFTSRHEDTVVSALVKVNVSTYHALSVAAVGGPGVAVRRTARSGNMRTLNAPLTVSSVDESLVNEVFSATVGFDATIHVSPRTALVFAWRLSLLNDDDLGPGGEVRRAVGSSVSRFCGGGRYSF